MVLREQEGSKMWYTARRGLQGRRKASGGDLSRVRMYSEQGINIDILDASVLWGRKVASGGITSGLEGSKGSKRGKTKPWDIMGNTGGVLSRLQGPQRTIQAREGSGHAMGPQDSFCVQHRSPIGAQRPKDGSS